MSTRTIGAVWALPPALAAPLTSADLLVLLRLAEVAHEDGRNAFLAVATIAEGCRVDRSTVQRSLRRLEEVGCIAVQHVARQHRPTVYRLTIPGLHVAAEMVRVEDQERPALVRSPQQPHPAAPAADDAAAQQPRHAAPGDSGAAQGPHRGRAGAAQARPDPDPDPDPSTTTTNVDAAEVAIAAASKPTAVKTALLAVRERFTIAPLSLTQEQVLDDYADTLEVSDVERAAREFEPALGWGYVVSVLGRIAANRKRGEPDPWAFGLPPRPTGARARGGAPPGARAGRVAPAGAGAGQPADTAAARAGWAPPAGAVGLAASGE